MKYIIYKCFLILLFAVIIKQVNATQNNFIFGAREAGLANSSLTLSGIGSIYHNPAGIVLSTLPAIGFNYENNYQVKELNTRSVAGIIPVNNGGFGASYSFFGTNRYNEQKLSFGYAHSLGKMVNAGIMFDYFLINLPDTYETDYALAGEIGLIIRPIQYLNIGAHINNVSGSNYKLYYNSELPSFFRMSIEWNTEKYLLSGLVRLDKYQKATISTGVELRLVKNLALRLGVSTDEKMSYSFGIGYKQKWIGGDIAFTKHPNLGFSSFITIELRLASLKK